MTPVRQPCVGVFSEINGHPTHVQVNVCLVYDPTDPLAATMVIDYGDELDRWVFARDLLDTSIRSRGLGDVKCRPSGHEMLLRLTGSADSTALLRLPREAVDIFLVRSYQQVPRGAEVVDVDGELQRLIPRHAHDPARCKQCRRRAGLPPTTVDGA